MAEARPNRCFSSTFDVGLLAEVSVGFSVIVFLIKNSVVLKNSVVVVIIGDRRLRGSSYQLKQVLKELKDCSDVL